MLTAFGVALLIADELRKAYVRRSRRDPQAAAVPARPKLLLNHQEA
jgi:hypothetical protein